MPLHKKLDVPLEEALNIAGTGLYTNYVTFTTGTIYFCALMSVQGMAIVMPAVGCDLKLTNAEKGVINSMTFTGMLFSGQLFGFLADTFGRKRVTLWSQLATSVLLVACGLAPSTTSLMVMLFINGFVLTGVLTPAYVYVSEFSPAQSRAKALIALTAIGALANVYLPGMAWLIMPLEIHLPVAGVMVFTSWRLFVILLTVPILLSTLLLWRLPESPKFLLSQGKPEETLEVLKSVFAANQKRLKEEYPVLSVCLDCNDQACSKADGNGNQLVTYFKMMMRQTYLLFSKRYAKYTLMSCALLLGEVGVFNSLLLWFPEQTSKIRHYSQMHGVYNVTLCDLMSSRSTVHNRSSNCQLNYSFFSANIILGSSQFVTCLLSSVGAEKIGRKLFLSICFIFTTGICFTTVFLTNEYLTIGALGLMTLLLYLTFPVTVSIIVEFFPTPLRSTATSITMIFGRLGATAGSQVMGLLFARYCEEAYFGMSVVLVVTTIICVALPVKKKS